MQDNTSCDAEKGMPSEEEMLREERRQPSGAGVEAGRACRIARCCSLRVTPLIHPCLPSPRSLLCRRLVGVALALARLAATRHAATAALPAAGVRRRLSTAALARLAAITRLARRTATAIGAVAACLAALLEHLTAAGRAALRACRAGALAAERRAVAVRALAAAQCLLRCVGGESLDAEERECR